METTARPTMASMTNMSRLRTSRPSQKMNLHKLHNVNLHLTQSSVKSTTNTTSNMTDERRVVALNNHGVRLLQQRNHRQATHCMLQALNHLKESIRSNKINKRPLPDKLSSSQEDDLQERTSGFTTQPLSSQASTSSCSTDSSLPFQMFDRVFTFSSSSTSSPTDLENCDGSSAMILYNMGVAYHARSLQDHTANKLLLSKALQMYNYALSAIQHWARHQQVHQGCHLLRLAILNNMAHVQGLLHKPAAAQHCLKCLKDILVYAKGQCTKEEYAFFSANVVVLCMTFQNGGGAGSLVKAPAAAA